MQSGRARIVIEVRNKLISTEPRDRTGQKVKPGSPQDPSACAGLGIGLRHALGEVQHRAPLPVYHADLAAAPVLGR